MDTQHLNETMLKRISQREPSWLVDIRCKAFQQFLNLPSPNFRYGTDIQLDTKELHLETINPEEIITQLKLPNSDTINVLTFNEALQKEPELIQNYFMKAIIPEDKLTALHYAFFNQGIVIHVPKNVHASYTFALPHNTTTLLTHLIIILEPNSTLNLIQETTSPHTTSHNEYAYHSEVVEVFVKENARLHFGNVQLLNKKTTCIVTRRALLEKEAFIEWLDVNLGGSFTRCEVSSWLNGTGATSYNYGMFLGHDRQQFDVLAAARHNASNTTCDMFTKGALTDYSRLVYRGLIKIEENAQHCNGYQKEDTLLLSENAVADSIPELEINNNDVRCTHGATIGQIDKEKLFYLQSRGIPKAMAQEKIVEGFFEPLIHKLTSANIQERVRELVAQEIK